MTLTLSEIRAVATVWEGAEIVLFFVTETMQDFTDFPILYKINFATSWKEIYFSLESWKQLLMLFCIRWGLAFLALVFIIVKQ